MRDAVLGAEPAAGVEVEEALRARRPFLELGRERREHLQARGRELAAESQLDGRPLHPGREQRLGLVPRQPGEARPIAAREPVAPRRAAHGRHRDSGGGERLDVAVDGADGDLEAVRDVGGSQLAARLQQEQERDETGGAHEFRA